jgi:hypothetical protein
VRHADSRGDARVKIRLVGGPHDGEEYEVAPDRDAMVFAGEPENPVGPTFPVTWAEPIVLPPVHADAYSRAGRAPDDPEVVLFEYDGRS